MTLNARCSLCSTMACHSILLFFVSGVLSSPSFRIDEVSLPDNGYDARGSDNALLDPGAVVNRTKEIPHSHDADAAAAAAIPPPSAVDLRFSPIERVTADLAGLIAGRALASLSGLTGLAPAIEGADGWTGRRNGNKGPGRPDPPSPWDSMAPALLIGGTLVALLLAAVGMLAGKALLASILAATVAAVQLMRAPPGPGGGGGPGPMG